LRIHTPVRRQAPTDEVELRDLLDRILDKGIFLGSANMLIVGETNLSSSQQRFSVSSPSEPKQASNPKQSKPHLKTV